MAAKSKASTKRKAAIKPPPANKPTRTAPSKPVIGFGTWIAIILFVALVGFMAYLNRDSAESDVEPTPTGGSTSMFNEADGLPISIEVKPAEGETTLIKRGADNAWSVEMPVALEADQGLSEAAASQFAAIQIISEIEAGKDPSIFGLNEPVYIITAEFTDGKKRVLEVGDNTPTNSGYYARLDGDKIYVVDLSGIDALTQLAMFPPYLNTPTPTPLPSTATPVPPAEPSVTPTP